MKRLTQEHAAYLKSRGYTHIAAIVKSHYTSKYYNVQSIDAIMHNDGYWIGEPVQYFYGKGYIRYGIIGTQIDWSRTILRTHV